MKIKKQDKWHDGLKLSLRVGSEVKIINQNEEMVFQVREIKGSYVRLCFKGDKLDWKINRVSE